MAKGPHLYNLPPLDPSVKAQDHLSSLMNEAHEHEDIVILDASLRAQKESEKAERAAEIEAEDTVLEARSVTAGEARASNPLLKVVSERNAVRLLVFTKNVAMRQLGSLAQKRLLELGTIFAEMHVVMLNEQTEEETIPTVRLADNIWLYSTESTVWWKTGFDAYRVAREQLDFAGGFRADIVLAEDPFESGAAAYFIASKYERPFQVHVLEDIFDPEFKEHDGHNAWRLFIADFIFPRADCIRTSSESIRERVVEKHPKLESFTEALPLYYNLEAWRDMTPTMSLKERYPQFKFIILHISSMHARSHTAEVIQGVAPILRLYPTIGLVIVGNGPYRSALEKQVIALGIHGQVEFEPVPDEILSHMKSANILIHLSEDAHDDTIILEAATVKLPMIALSTSIAGTLFKDSESAFLCDTPDPACVSYRVKNFLNDNQARTRLALNAQEAVFERIEQDYTAYLLSYRSSIERCIG